MARGKKKTAKKFGELTKGPGGKVDARDFKKMFNGQISRRSG